MTSLLALLKITTHVEVLSLTCDVLLVVTKNHVTNRDCFEPTGSKCLLTCMKHFVAGECVDVAVLTFLQKGFALGRSVARSENNKFQLMKCGMGDLVLQWIPTHSSAEQLGFASETPATTTAPVTVFAPPAETTAAYSPYHTSIHHITQEACLMMRELCLHDDIRKDMSCAFENGKHFIGHGSAPPLLRIAGHFNQAPSLASSALAAAKQLITTEESVKIMALNGAMKLPLAIYHMENAPLMLLRSVTGVMRNLCADDVRKNRLVSDGTMMALVHVMSFEHCRTDYVFMEQGVACLAAMSLRSPSNAQKIIEQTTILDVLCPAMRRFMDRSGLLRQACLWVRNTAARCPEYRGMLLDTGLEDVLRLAGASHRDVVDEAYGALRDLECEVQCVKIMEDGKVEAAYETFGGKEGAPKAPLRFNPVWDDKTEILEKLVEEESMAPFDSNGNHAAAPKCCDQDH